MRIVAVSRAMDGHEGLLVQILGLLAVPYPGAQEPHQHRTDLVQQLAIRVRVAALRRSTISSALRAAREGNGIYPVNSPRWG